MDVELRSLAEEALSRSSITRFGDRSSVLMETEFVFGDDIESIARSPFKDTGIGGVLIVS